MFKTKEFKLNESLITPSGNSAYLASWISFLTRETPSMYKDSPEVNLCYPDTAAHMDDIDAGNPQARLRHAAVNNATSDIIDTLIVQVLMKEEAKYIYPLHLKLI